MLPAAEEGAELVAAEARPVPRAQEGAQVLPSSSISRASLSRAARSPFRTRVEAVTGPPGRWGSWVALTATSWPATVALEVEVVTAATVAALAVALAVSPWVSSGQALRPRSM